jgi:hypothetical protein
MPKIAHGISMNVQVDYKFHIGAYLHEGDIRNDTRLKSPCFHPLFCYFASHLLSGMKPTLVFNLYS